MKFKKQKYSDGAEVLIVVDDAGERVAAVNMGANATHKAIKDEAKKWKSKGAMTTAMPSMISQEDVDPDA